ncbi:hypothetical protein [Thermicanus aegyptius]|uniref:hypothetical protein n=1 Tax=Thermicanus aegyptius TaxID=94009 RepID=UPI0003FA6215|nr:hypothetical protein [Thermicanus aegyptius]
MTIAEQLFKEGMEKGIEQGIKKGIEKGKLDIARKMLLKHPNSSMVCFLRFSSTEDRDIS